jgi:hypothetical protein
VIGRAVTAKVFAAHVGWTWHEPDPDGDDPMGEGFFVAPVKNRGTSRRIDLPERKAPVHEHFAFIGHVIEAKGLRPRDVPAFFSQADAFLRNETDDWSCAAMLAATCPE